MDPTDITVQILREIRDGVNQTNARLDHTRDELSARLDQTNARSTGTEIPLATEIVAVAAAIREVRDELRDDRRLRARVDDHERRIGVLERSRDEAAH